MNEALQKPEAAAGNTTADAITDKRGFGRRWGFSPRKIDNLLAMGMPHLKIGKRRVRIIIPEADAWMGQQFRIQRVPR
jgi:hypothetical protein